MAYLACLLCFVGACTSTLEPPSRPGELVLLVTGKTPTAARNAVSQVEGRLRAARGVTAVHGARGNARLFFAVRWPLYVPMADLLRIQSSIQGDSEARVDKLIEQILTPLALREWPRANLLYGTSQPYAATPDERSIALSVRFRPDTQSMVKQTLAMIEREQGAEARFSVDSSDAQALLYGSPYPLWLEAADAARARAIVKQVDDLRKKRPSFPLRAAHTLQSYLPENATGQLILSQALRALLKSDFVAKWSSARRDAVRDLVPLPLTRLPVTEDLPEYLKAPYRDEEQGLHRTVLLLARPELDARRARDRAQVKNALRELGLESSVTGAFLAPSKAPLPYPWLLALSVPSLLLALATALRRRGRRARLLFGIAVLSLLGVLTCLGLGPLLRTSLQSRYPQLTLAQLTVWPWGSLDVHDAAVALPHAQLRIPKASLALTVRGLELSAEGVSVEVSHKLSSEPLKETLVLGDVRVDAPLSRLQEIRSIRTSGGDVELDLMHKQGTAGWFGSLTLTPSLFGRLPLLAKAPAFNGVSLSTGEAQQVWLSDGFELKGR